MGPMNTTPNFHSVEAPLPGDESVLYSFNNPTSNVLAIAGGDHDPVTVYEALEFIVWGSQTGAVWEEGKITAIYDEGVDAGWVYDDFSSVWSFSEAYTMFAVNCPPKVGHQSNWKALVFMRKSLLRLWQMPVQLPEGPSSRKWMVRG
jgi:hypothetical protein